MAKNDRIPFPREILRVLQDLMLKVRAQEKRAQVTVSPTPANLPAEGPGHEDITSEMAEREEGDK